MRVILSRLIQFCKLDFFFEFFYCLNVLQKFVTKFTPFKELIKLITIHAILPRSIQFCTIIFDNRLDEISSLEESDVCHVRFNISSAILQK